ncbi:MAG: ParA family protein [Chitinophagaceae bacterium]|jgi:cellulose biosynthesis protein BcsQ|nr:ParA family protein [Chitinophagaceae bacterium]
MTTVALYNIKGGVGKTAGCVNLAYLAAEEGKNVLIWDLDPQGSASFYFSVEPGIKGGVRKLLAQEGSGLENSIRPTAYEQLYLLPADFSNRYLDVVIEETKQAKKKMKALLASLQGRFDYLFIDCPPGIGPLSEAIFAAADFVVLPSIPTTLSIRTYEMALAFFEENNLDPARIVAYFSMVDIRKNLHNETLAKYYKNKQFLRNYIPYLSTVEKMGSHLAPVAAFAPSSYAAQCYRDLWKELKKKTGI